MFNQSNTQGTVGKIGNIDQNFSGKIGTNDVQISHDLKDLLANAKINGNIRLVNSGGAIDDQFQKSILNELSFLNKRINQSEITKSDVIDIRNSITINSNEILTRISRLEKRLDEINTKFDKLTQPPDTTNEIKEKDRVINTLQIRIQDLQKELQSKNQTKTNDIKLDDSTASQIKKLQEIIFEQKVTLGKQQWEIEKLTKDTNHSVKDYEYKTSLKNKDLEIQKQKELIEKLRNQIVAISTITIQ